MSGEDSPGEGYTGQRQERHASEGHRLPRGKPRGANVGHHPPFLVFPCIPVPCRSLCWQPRKETHLRKQWAVERSQLELMRTAPQMCEPWNRRLACYSHWPASTSRPP